MDHNIDTSSPPPPTPASSAATNAPSSCGHWDAVYRDRGPDQVSWHQAQPQPSLDLITGLDPAPGSAIIDVGGGASPLAAWLTRHGFTDVTVLDVSEQALQLARATAGPASESITWVCADLLTWSPTRTYQIWHDRAVFHFLTDPADRAAYLSILRRALAVGGTVVLGTFAPNGPTRCSGLPVARYGPNELAAELGDGFALTLAHRDRHRTPSGAVQPFTWITARRT